MKYVKQLLVIIMITLAGELLHRFIPLPVPAGIYGMMILLAGLLSGVIRLDSVKETGKFLIEIMPVMFIPAAVELITGWQILKTVLVPAVVITFVTLVAVMAATGSVAQWFIRTGQRTGKPITKEESAQPIVSATAGQEDRR